MVTVGVQLICVGTRGRRKIKERLHIPERRTSKKVKKKKKGKRKTMMKIKLEPLLRTRGEKPISISENFTGNFRIYCSSLRIFKRQY